MLQPAFFFEEKAAFRDNVKSGRSEVFFKMAVYLKHFTNFRETIRGGVFSAKI